MWGPGISENAGIPGFVANKCRVLQPGLIPGSFSPFKIHAQFQNFLDLRDAGRNNGSGRRGPISPGVAFPQRLESETSRRF